MNQPTQPTHRWLGLSAFALATLLILLATRDPARADLVNSTPSTTALTVNANDRDILVILDTRSEQLLTYLPGNQQALELFSKQSLPELFEEARQRSGLPPTPQPHNNKPQPPRAR